MTHPLAPFAFLLILATVAVVILLTIFLRTRRADEAASNGEWDRECERERGDY